MAPVLKIILEAIGWRIGEKLIEKVGKKKKKAALVPDSDQIIGGAEVPRETVMQRGSFDHAFEDVLLVEGGYSDNPSDSGGRTMYGITESVARAHGYTGPMETLGLDDAKRIYKVAYWDSLKLDIISGLSEKVAFEIFDTGVNCGTGTAARFFQRSLNVLNRREALYPDLKIDGSIGPVTIDRFRNYLDARGRIIGETVMLNALDCLQGERYIVLAETREKDQNFVFGWLRNRVFNVDR